MENMGATIEAGFDRYRPRLRKTALRFTKNGHDADDIVQEAFVRWLSSPPRDSSTPEAWLVTIVQRLCVDSYRRRSRERLTDDTGWQNAFSVAPHFEWLEREGELRAVLQRLRERASIEESAALVLREAYGFSYSDIAAALGKSQEACRQLVHRGKAAALGERPVRRPGGTVPARICDDFIAALRDGNMHCTLQALGNLAGCATPSYRLH